MRWLQLCLLTARFLISNAEQRIVQGPSDTDVRLGGTVILECRVEEQQGAVQWVKNGFGLGNDRSLSAFPRYSMEGSTSNGEYNLRIADVELDDDDVYECQIQAAAGNNPTQISKPARLSVLVEPQPPLLLNKEASLKAIAGRQVQQTCTSVEGKPPAVIGWAISNDRNGSSITTLLGNTREKLHSVSDNRFDSEDVQKAHVEEHTHSVNKQTYTVNSTITFSPRAEDDGRFLVCLVFHKTYATFKSESILLDISYGPKVELNLDEGSKLRQGGFAHLSCSVRAKPFNNVEISWFKDSKKLPLATTDTLSINNLGIEHHQTNYTCTARNNIDEASASIKLNVSYGAQIMSDAQYPAVNPGDDVSFHCEAIGNPPPTVHWKKAGDHQIIGRGSNLTIESVQSWQRGEYECIATVEGFEPARLVNYLHIKGPPSISLTEDKVAATGEDVELICEVRGRPPPNDVIWLHKGSPIEYGRPGGHLQIYKVARQYGVESKLVLRGIRENDFGEYNCTAFNELGKDFRVMELKAQNMVDAFIRSLPSYYFLPIAFIGAAIAAVVLFCLYWRCRQRKYKKASRFNDEQSDVTVKCEALDGGQFFPEMYSSSPLENAEIICSKDYISIPQSNPDLDYLPPPNFVGGTYQPYINQPADYVIGENRFEPSYGSFTSGLSTPGGTVSEMYGYNNSSSKYEGAPLETLAEVTTPNTENGPPLLLNAARVHDRPGSRTSTHV